MPSKEAELRYFSHTLSRRSTQIDKYLEELEQTKWMQKVEAKRDAEAQEALRSSDASLEEANEVWKLKDER